MSRSFFIYFTITGVEKIVRYIEVFVIKRFVISRFHCTVIDAKYGSLSLPSCVIKLIKETLTRLTPIGNNEARLFKKGGQ